MPESKRWTKARKRLDQIEYDILSRRVTDSKAFKAEMNLGAREARAMLDELQDHRRDALVSLVADVLTEAAATVDEWLDGALVVGPNEKVGINILLQMGNIDQQVVRLRSQNEQERRKRIADLNGIVAGTHGPATSNP